MSTAEDNPKNTTVDQPAGRRFLRIFVIAVVTVAAAVASVNLVAWRFMLAGENQSIVQLLSGWGRLYKPILHDQIEPEIVVFGASWARDAFDPIETGQLLGRTFFNHGVSGGTAYETRRFVKSALGNPNLQAAIINLNTFYRDSLRARFRYGFDESILNVDTLGRPNRLVGLRRAYSLALGGWAVGANVKLISTILARDRGVARPDYLESYEQADHTRRNMQRIRQQIFPDSEQRVKPPPASQEERSVEVAADELQAVVDGLCARGVDIHAYFTPSHTYQQKCDLAAPEQQAALSFFRDKQRSCASRIHLYHFSYPNAMTLEGVLGPVTASYYYRPDGHPRPTAGLVMASAMFGKPFPPGTPQALVEDFGVDLLRHDDAEGWLLERAARCAGDWGAQGTNGIVRALTSP